MKKCCVFLLCLLLMSTAALAQDNLPASLGNSPEEVILPAALLHLYVPSGMDRTEGDIESHDQGFRLTRFDDTFSITVYVHDNHFQTPKDYVANYMQHKEFSAVADEMIGEIRVQRLTKADDPENFEIVVMPQLDEEFLSSPGEDFAIYHLMFSCDTPEANALAQDVLSTLSDYE